MNPDRTLLLDDGYAIIGTRLTGPPARPDDLGTLLDSCAKILPPESVVMLAGTWEQLLFRFAGDVRCGDWAARVSDAQGDPWTRWTHVDGGMSLWTADIDVMEVEGRSTPLIRAAPAATALALHRWATRTGRPWTGTPGMTGNSLLRDRDWKLEPKWRLDRWPLDCVPERAYSPLQWSREPGAEHVHGYDLNRAYLAALLNLEPAAGELEHRVGGAFDPSRGGAWRVELAPWMHGDALPDPAGYGDVADDGSRWLTTPRLQLLTELQDAPRFVHGGFRVLESYTSPTRRILRDWAEQLRDIANDGGDLEYAAKRVYQETWGMWANKTRIYRPDWHYSVLALAGANLWRKIARHAEAGYYPTRIETDAVFYASDNNVWAAAAPPGMRLDLTGSGQLGKFKPIKEEQPT